MPIELWLAYRWAVKRSRQVNHPTTILSSVHVTSRSNALSTCSTWKDRLPTFHSGDPSAARPRPLSRAPRAGTAHAPTTARRAAAEDHLGLRVGEQAPRQRHLLGVAGAGRLQ